MEHGGIAFGAEAGPDDEFHPAPRRGALESCGDGVGLVAEINFLPLNFGPGQPGVMQPCLGSLPRLPNRPAQPAEIPAPLKVEPAGGGVLQGFAEAADPSERGPDTKLRS